MEKSAILSMMLVSFIFAEDGKITFYNRGYLLANGDAASALDANTGGIFRLDGRSGAGDGFTAGLFLASDLGTPLTTTAFRPSSGPLSQVFAITQDVAIPGVPPGQTANLVVRVWETGKTYFTSPGRNEQAFTSQPLGGANPILGQPDILVPGLTGFTGFLVPEPSTLALGVTALGALTILRRRI